MRATEPQLHERDRRLLLEAFVQFPWIREVRLFGSRARGQVRRASDIDLAIDAPIATDIDWARLAAILDELPIIYRIDLVRLSQPVSKALREQIVRDGIVLYSAPQVVDQAIIESKACAVAITE